MLRYFLSIKLLFLTFTVFAQPRFNEDSLNYPLQYGPGIRSQFHIEETGRYVRDSNQKNCIHLENGFRKSAIINKEDWLNIKDDVKPGTVTLIFSKFPLRKGVYYEIYPLLCSRLKYLFTFDPELNDVSINYRIILQTDCPGEKEVAKLYHGFRIDFDSVSIKLPDLVPDSLSSVNGLTVAQMKSLLNIPDTATSITGLEADTSRLSGYLEKSITKGKTPVEKMPTAAELEGTAKKLDQFIRFFSISNKDSTVYRIMNRNSQWDSILVVVDWTGSMYRYGADILKWHLLHFSASPIKYFVLFNDGDNKKVKEIGSTGGIYNETANNIDELFKLYNLVMLKGRGGEAEENDIEAVLKGIELYPKHKSVILIADNSCIRDIQLASQIHEPVNVIMVGYNPIIGVNPQYVELARNTKGSIHTIEDDISYAENYNANLSKTIKITSHYIFCDYFYPINDDTRIVSSRIFGDIDSAYRYDGGYVTLNLSHKNLSRLPKKIRKFDNITGLDLSYNHMSNLQLKFSQAIQLQKLKLNHNELTVVPSNVSKFAYIRDVDLSNNRLTKIPGFIFGLRALRFLNLSYNRIDSLPEIQTRSIRKLALNNNQLVSLSKSFGTLRYLEELDLSNNQLTTLPASFTKCKKIKFLKLNNNRFTSIPPEIARLKSLQVLDIRNNPLGEKEIEKIRILLPKTEIEY